MPRALLDVDIADLGLLFLLDLGDDGWLLEDIFFFFFLEEFVDFGEDFLFKFRFDKVDIS